MVIFSILSIFITCLGLLGLISYNTTQRSQEIAIRKTLGASVNKIVFLLSGETIRLLVIPTILSIPFYFGIKQWLQNFAFHIKFGPLLFIVLLIVIDLVLLVIVLMTIGFNAYKAATANPAEYLKNKLFHTILLETRLQLIVQSLIFRSQLI